VRRFGRILFKVATALSAILFLITAVLWVWSYREVHVVANTGYCLRQLVIADGHVFVQSVGLVDRNGYWHSTPPIHMGPRERLTHYDEATAPYSEAAHEEGWTHTTLPPGGLPKALVASRTPEGEDQIPSPAGIGVGTQPVARLLAASESFRVVGRFDAQMKGTEQILTGRTAWAPLWMFAVAAAVLPSSSVGRFWVKRRRCGRRDGHCPACGYDLRATPDRCPECGKVAKA
jgi:hypothetical protein